MNAAAVADALAYLQNMFTNSSVNCLSFIPPADDVQDEFESNVSSDESQRQRVWCVVSVAFCMQITHLHLVLSLGP